MIDCLGLQTKEAKLNCKRLEVTSEGEAAHDGWRVSVTDQWLRVYSLHKCSLTCAFVQVSAPVYSLLFTLNIFLITHF